MQKKPYQKILFGSPGTGKSYKINTEYLKDLGIVEESPDHIPVVFHPEYTYGDFMGKLMPLSKLGEGVRKVEYNFYTGHFLKALGRAYKNIIQAHIDKEKEVEVIIKSYKDQIKKTNIEKQFTPEERAELEAKKQNVTLKPSKNVLLVIDEINRGNSAAIFGTVFQLLDRKKNGWSSYSVTISDLEHLGLEREIGIEHEKKFDKKWYDDTTFEGESIKENRYTELTSYIFSDLKSQSLLKEKKIKIPPNLHIVATMNTSDNSIYFMDNAFKRRWDWEFIQPDLSKNEWEQVKEKIGDRKIKIKSPDGTENFEQSWYEFKKKLNKFILSQHETIRKIDDKQIGYFFIDEKEVTKYHITSKLLFFIWDSVFPNNKKPLVELLWGKDKAKVNKSKLVSFGQFSRQENVWLFVQNIWNEEFLIK